MDALTAYAPHGTGTLSGLAAVLLAPNKIVGVAMLVIGQAADIAKTYWDRLEKGKKEEKDAD